MFNKNPYQCAAQGYCFSFSPHMIALTKEIAVMQGGSGLGLFPYAYGPEYHELKLAVEREMNGLIYTTGHTALDTLQGVVMLAPAALVLNPGKALFSLFG